jgi:hypothetical protein
MEISNVDSIPTVRFDLTGEMMWQKIRPILHCETLDFILSGQLDTHNMPEVVRSDLSVRLANAPSNLTLKCTCTDIADNLNPT